LDGLDGGIPRAQLVARVSQRHVCISSTWILQVWVSWKTQDVTNGPIPKVPSLFSWDHQISGFRQRTAMPERQVGTQSTPNQHSDGHDMGCPGTAGLDLRTGEILIRTGRDNPGRILENHETSRDSAR
jgi:hypothetical protein